MNSMIYGKYTNIKKIATVGVFFLCRLYLCELCEGEEVRIIKIRYKF